MWTERCQLPNSHGVASRGPCELKRGFCCCVTWAAPFNLFQLQVLPLGSQCHGLNEVKSHSHSGTQYQWIHILFLACSYSILGAQSARVRRSLPPWHRNTATSSFLPGWQGPFWMMFVGGPFFFFWSWYVILSVVRQSGQVTSCAATSDHTKALYLCWLHSENDDVVHKSCWGWHRLAEDESPGCRDWSTIWENCWESFVLFCFSMLETQLRTLYVLGKYLSNELHPFSPPPFFLSEMRYCYVDLVGLEFVTLLLNVGSIGAYTGVFFSLI